MKISKKQVLIGIILLAVIICTAGIYLFNRSDSNIWEREFYHCADDLKSRIDQVDASEYVLPEYDEKVRQDRIEVYSDTWQAYINFVENWAKLQGGTPEEREEIYRQATLLMVLIDDNHDGNYGFHDVNRKYCTLSYDHGKTREELLFSGNQALQRKNVVDESMELLREEFEHADHYGLIYDLEEFAWETEFHNCVERYADTFNNKADIQVLRLWEEFVEQWADNNEAYAFIDSGSGLSIEIAEARRECYRTAVLLMICSMEQNGQEYQFVYDMEEDREKLLKWLSRDLFRDVYTIYGGSLGFMDETYNPDKTFKEELIKGLQDALQRRDIAGYAADIAADYKQMSEEEIRQHVQRDDSQILASYYYGVMGEDAEWFLFNRDEDIIVREKTDEEGFEYVYYKFPYLGEGEYGTALPAYGKTSDYYFIQWEEEDYLMVTRRESSGETVDGVGVYSMLGYSLIGTVLCLDKDIDTVRFLSYVFAGTQPYDMRLPDY